VEKFSLLFPFFPSLLITLGVAYYCWRRRSVNGALPYMVVALSQTFMTTAYLCEVLAPDLKSKIFWDDLGHLFLTVWLSGFGVFVLNYHRAAAVNAAGFLQFCFSAFLVVSIIQLYRFPTSLDALECGPG
jgi:hypothetical protein